MKNYLVYGIGNALVDLEIEVMNEFLNKMNVEKGMMTLVDDVRQNELMQHLDGVQHKRSSGGSAANTILAVAQLGGKTYYSCKVANDDLGDFYYSDLKEAGVETNIAAGREDGTTGKCMVFITPDADRTMNTYLGITAQFSKQELSLDDLANSQYLYIEGYLVTSALGIEAAVISREHARANNTKIALTFSDPGIVSYFRDGLKEMIGNKKIDFIFCNEEEALCFTETNTVAEATLALKQYATCFAITQGARGAVLFDGEKEIDIVTNQVEAVDTNGAGDLFAGTFLWGLTNNLSFSDCGKLACQASSVLVTQFGARLRPSQLMDIKESTL